MKLIGADTSAQTSLDFLMGISIFALAFLFVITFIPGMFTPFHSNSDDLTMTADRVAALLVEDVLAQDNQSSKIPGVINTTKLDNCENSLTAIGTNLTYRRSLGLNASGDQVYNLEIEIEKDGQPNIKFNNGQEPGNTNVGQSRRFVMIRDKDATGIDKYPGRMAILTVRVWS